MRVGHLNPSTSWIQTRDFHAPFTCLVVLRKHTNIFVFSIISWHLNYARSWNSPVAISTTDDRDLFAYFVWSISYLLATRTRKRKCHFDELFGTGCTESCQNDNFQCSQWRKFRQNDNKSVSVRSQIIYHPTWYIPSMSQYSAGARSVKVLTITPIFQYSDIDLVLMDNSGLSNRWVKFVQNISTSRIKTSGCLTHKVPAITLQSSLVITWSIIHYKITLNIALTVL